MEPKFCVNCEFCQTTTGSHVCHARAKKDLDFVTGRVTHVTGIVPCADKNTDGNCADFKEKEKRHSWWFYR